MLLQEDFAAEISYLSDVVVEVIYSGVCRGLNSDFYGVFVVEGVDDHASFLVGGNRDEEGL